MENRPQFLPVLRVGIEQVDQEHQRLIEIAGQVYDSLAANGADAVAAARAAIVELLDYAATHFASEEALMAAAGYPELAAHRQLHEQLLSQARDMALRVESGDPYVPGELNRLIYHWMVKHIQTEDRRFGEFVAAR
ncbi:hypothetical protein B9N43_08735 [Denitratisoma sp. DHT3]|uniref:bacteriohemerythrin n=1 Tax=Denitratisoma sp. DHT3 TaxID=1981880 RepID=UPI0011988B75|nr:bacteriohemerythrin [Denitratisoma sp. DHT3]QDX81319.1 hypothetical protein B9N43_08735 [Denitratisoma sp. DHT3]